MGWVSAACTQLGPPPSARLGSGLALAAPCRTCPTPPLHPHPLAAVRRGLAEVWQSMQARGDLTPMHFPEAREQAGPPNLKRASLREGSRGSGRLWAPTCPRGGLRGQAPRSALGWPRNQVRPVSDRQALRLLAEHVAEALAGASPPWQVPARIHIGRAGVATGACCWIGLE